MVTLLIFLLILSVLVLIHELGHFLVAKKLGIKVEEFGFGFPPRAFSIKKGETVYSVNWLPIGGFVKLYGEDEAGGGRLSLPVSSSKYKVSSKNGKNLNTKYIVPNTDLSRAFFARSVPQRAAVVIAGVVMNVLLAAFIYYVFLGITNFKTDINLLYGNHRFFGVNQVNKTELIISAVSKDSPAQKAGITPLSQIISINGIKNPAMDQFIQIINTHKGKEVNVVWKNSSSTEVFSKTIMPRVNPPKNQGALGVAFFPVNTAHLSYDTPVQKLLSGFIHPTNLMMYNFNVLGRLIQVSYEKKTTEPVSDAVSGPVGIYMFVGNVVQIPDAKERILQILNIAGMLSMSLAFFNILPIPALDGGRLFFIAIEGVTRKKVNPRFEGFAHAVGMAVLLTFMLLVTFKDVFKLFSK